MSDIMLPPFEDLMLPTLCVLRDMGGSGSIEEVNERLIEIMKFSSAQTSAIYPKSGAFILPDRMSWARSYLKIASLLTSGGRGIWVLTESGRHACDLESIQLRRIVADAYNASVAARKKEAISEDAEPPLPEEATFEAEEAVLDWSDMLLARVQSIEPAAFERLCQRLLREHGFTRVEVTGKSGDGGIDGQGVLRVNLVSFHVLFQCKRYKGSVSSGAIRDFRGAMQGRADKGLVITTGSFTPDARREATRDGAPAIDLIDGRALCELLREKELGVVVRPVTSYEISMDDAFFDDI